MKEKDQQLLEEALETKSLLNRALALIEQNQADMKRALESAEKVVEAAKSWQERALKAEKELAWQQAEQQAKQEAAGIDAFFDSLPDSAFYVAG